MYSRLKTASLYTKTTIKSAPLHASGETRGQKGKAEGEEAVVEKEEGEVARRKGEAVGEGKAALTFGMPSGTSWVAAVRGKTEEGGRGGERGSGDAEKGRCRGDGETGEEGETGRCWGEAGSTAETAW